MSKDATRSEHGVHSTVDRLTESLRSYIEAQYHIRNESLIRERRKLLEEHGAVSQVPYVESTPVYELGPRYGDLRIPAVVQNLLTALAELEIGLFARPYVHQAQALEAFFGDRDDLIVATGTGSGKTESFLMPILGHLAEEAALRPLSASKPGCRAILLYPMNALVNDQLSRIRKLFGDERASRLISHGRAKPVRFGSYTGRTPYPGIRSSARDTQRIAPLFESFFLRLAGDEKKKGQLEAIGQWPAKDLVAFYAKHLEETRASANGKSRLYRHWNQRLLTQPSDRELMTRHETQAGCPDLLVTNYSMLEYMLMRPIERPLFQQTRDWLHSDDANELVIVLDEAHMYRGAGGAEVALLLRRLAARLGVARERIRFILTSASLGSGDDAVQAVKRFGRDLTGLSEKSDRQMTVIKGTREKRSGAKAGTQDESAALSRFDLTAFERHATDPVGARSAVSALSNSLGWGSLPEDAELTDYLYARLTGFGPLELLVQLVSGLALPLHKLENELFPNSPSAKMATGVLLALATYARRKSDKRVLLPTRLHMFFRGLPGLYVCSNPKCNDTRNKQAREHLLGRLHAQLNEGCSCGSRIYELLTHRECGTAFLRAYIDGPRGNFLWHVPSGPLREGHQAPLTEVDILVEGEPQPDRLADCIEAWLDTRSGRLAYEQPAAPEGFRKVFIPSPGPEWGRRGLKFDRCPLCNIETMRSGRSTIMDHSTKGEAPFATLVKTQLDAQPAVKQETRDFPNGGRKVLLFSDGRQKAARLARDIPREVEQDIFRQILALATHRLQEAGIEPRPTSHLYIAALTVLRDFNLPIFDRGDAVRVENAIQQLEKDYATETLKELITEFSSGDTPARFKIALLRQLCGRYYSLVGTAVGLVLPSKKATSKLHEVLSATAPSLSPSDIEQLAITWVSGLADRYAWDRELSDHVRGAAAGFWSDKWGANGKFEKTIRPHLAAILGVAPSTVDSVEDAFADQLSQKHDNGNYFLNPNMLQLRIDLSIPWHQCTQCTALLPATIRGHCASCGCSVVEELDPLKSEYIRARKGFWRDPIREVLNDGAKLRSISVEEHTAQLSNRDNAQVYATTEQFELRFRDIQIEARDRAIDVLSCTTTMEVGVDIGSLVAVGLRNVPPQRENYQQRAGRAGRRGSSVSTVLTDAQNGPHDSYYYETPEQIVSGDPRNPEIKIDNPKIARRHITSFLLQTYFHAYMDEHEIPVGGATSALFRALGKAGDFFFGEADPGTNFRSFTKWVEENVIDPAGSLRRQIRSWLPDTLRTESLTLDQWIESVAKTLLTDLEALKSEFRHPSGALPPAKDTGEGEGENEVETDDPDDRGALGDEELLEFLFARGMLPSYAFPTDLTSFLVEQLKRSAASNSWTMEIVQRPQQGIAKALSEYAPGRLIVINKETYRSGGVVANVLPTVHDRAAPLFAGVSDLIHCSNCNFVRDLEERGTVDPNCPVCGSELQSTRMIVPQVFTPEDGKPLSEDDRDQEFTYATSAQFPVPVGESDLPDLIPFGPHIASAVTADRKLVVANKGQLLDDRHRGFWICEKCGRASNEEPPAASHQRPYSIEFSFGQPNPPRLCNGQFQNVFLGHVFSTDLLLLRLKIAKPIVTDTSNPIILRALEDSLYSISEALRLCASRHPQLDLDPSEFGAGFRIVPARDGDELYLDMYLYDTLAGGAGYAELAGRHLKQILADVLDLLENCRGKCDQSCEKCLRHYHNQHLRDRLDRHIGAQLLRYVLTGQVPPEPSVEEQVNRLAPLKRMLELDGFSCRSPESVRNELVPLVAEKNGRRFAVGLQSGLLERAWKAHSLQRLIDKNAVDGKVLNDFILRRNLPDEHQLIRDAFPTAYP